jgi:hypothetical protein
MLAVETVDGATRRQHDRVAIFAMRFEITGVLQGR